jgi:hypothetical protein
VCPALNVCAFVYHKVLLLLHPSRLSQDPVCTPHGILYSKEAILESLLQQKKANKRKLASWEAQQQQEQQKADERASIAEQAALLAFDRQNHMGASEAAASSIQSAIQEEAELLLAEKKVVNGAVNIIDNKEKMKVGRGLPVFVFALRRGRACSQRHMVYFPGPLALAHGALGRVRSGWRHTWGA